MMKIKRNEIIHKSHVLRKLVLGTQLGATGDWEKTNTQKSWDQVGWVLWWRHTASTISNKFIVYSGKPGSRATVLEGCDIVVFRNGGRWDSYSLHVNILQRAAVLHFALTPFCSWGLCQILAYRLFAIDVLMSSSHRLLILYSPHIRCQTNVRCPTYGSSHSYVVV
jgi:hypothetical protein